MARNSRFSSSGKPDRKQFRKPRGESKGSSGFHKPKRDSEGDKGGERASRSAGPRSFDRGGKPGGFRGERSNRPGSEGKRPFARPGFRKGPGAPERGGEGKSFGARPFREKRVGDQRRGPGSFAKSEGDRFSKGGDRGGPGKDNRFDRGGSTRFNKPEGDRFSKGGDRRGPTKDNRFDRGGSTRFNKPEGDRFNKGGDRRGPAKDNRYSRESGDRFERKEDKRSFVESRTDRARKPSGPTERKKDPEKVGDDLIRLNKFISNSGVCSRREADDLIKMGLITVNGKSVIEMGYKVKPTDDVRYEGKRLTAEEMVYILLNKPKGYITTTDDPQERNTVMHLIERACKQRVYPVGRLDRNTSGLLLLTNDGDLTDKLTHPSYNVKKIYKAELDKPLSKADFQKVRDGVELEEGRAMVDDLAVVSEDGKTIGIEIHIGWNRVIRRIFETLGYEVIKLDRSVFAGLDKKELSRGHWRFLREEEVVRLKHFK